MLDYCTEFSTFMLCVCIQPLSSGCKLRNCGEKRLFLWVCMWNKIELFHPALQINRNKRAKQQFNKPQELSGSRHLCRLKFRLNLFEKHCRWVRKAWMVARIKLPNRARENFNCNWNKTAILKSDAVKNDNRKNTKQKVVNAKGKQKNQKRICDAFECICAEISVISKSYRSKLPLPICVVRDWLGERKKRNSE